MASLIKNDLSDYIKAREALLASLKGKYGEAKWADKDKPISKKIKESPCNIKFKFNKKHDIEAIVLGVHPSNDELKVYNPKSERKYFIEVCSIIEIDA